MAALISLFWLACSLVVKIARGFVGLLLLIPWEKPVVWISILCMIVGFVFGRASAPAAPPPVNVIDDRHPIRDWFNMEPAPEYFVADDLAAEDGEAPFEPMPDEISTPLWHKSHSDAYVDAKGDKPLLVFWSASWCKPCRDLKPTIEAALEKYRGHVSAVELDIDANPELAAKYGVYKTFVPRVFLYDSECRNGIEVTHRRDLEKLIEQRLLEPVR